MSPYYAGHYMADGEFVTPLPEPPQPEQPSLTEPSPLLQFIQENIDDTLADCQEYAAYLHVNDLLGPPTDCAKLLEIELTHSGKDQKPSIKTTVVDTAGVKKFRVRPPSEKVTLTMNDLWDKVSWILVPDTVNRELNDTYQFVSAIAGAHVYISSEQIFVAQLSKVGLTKARNSELFGLVTMLRRRIPIPPAHRSTMGLTDYYDFMF